MVLIGGGKMGRALLQGMLSAKVVSASALTVVEKDATSRQWWQTERPDIKVAESHEAVVHQAALVILAVKPKDLAGLVGSLTGLPACLISVAAGVTLDQLTQWSGSQRVIRVMPNTPALVGCGVSAFACAPGVRESDRHAVDAMLSAVGIAAEVDEAALDAVTGLSGSGPAYIFQIIEALADGGVAAGLPRALAQQFAAQTVRGAAQMVLETGQHPAELKDAVASPAGTTIAGLSVLEQNGVRGALIAAVQAATHRCRELRD